MKILHINSYYNGSSFYDNIFKFQRKEHTVDIYCHMSKSDNNSILDSNCIIGRPYRRIFKYFYFAKHRRIWRDINSRFTISTYDIVHAHSLFSNGFEAYKIFNATGTPYIVSIRNTDINVFYKYLLYLRPLALHILLYSKKIIFISQPYKDYLINKLIPKKYRQEIEMKSVVIPNGIDDFWFNNSNLHKRSQNKIRVISAAVIDHNKNHIAVCKALNILNAKGYDVSFNVFGRVVSQAELRKLKHYSFFENHKPVTKEELIKQMQNNDIFAMPSIHETFGIAYGEAISQGLPVIYTKNQGFDGQFDNGEVGFAVEPNDYSQIANAIEKAFINYDSISIGLPVKAKKYKWETINKKLLSIYTEE